MNGRGGNPSLPGEICGRCAPWPAWVGAAGSWGGAACRAARWTDPSLTPLARLVSEDWKLEAGRGGGMLVFFSPQRAFAKSIGDEPLGSVPEFMPGFRGDVLAVGPPPARAAGAAPRAGGDPAGVGAAAGEPGPLAPASEIEGEPVPGANGEGVPGGLGGVKCCGIPFRPPLPGVA